MKGQKKDNCSSPLYLLTGLPSDSSLSLPHLSLSLIYPL